MHDYMKALQRQFESTPRSIQELSDEIDRTHKELSSRLAKEDRKLLLKLVDMEDDLHSAPRSTASPAATVSPAASTGRLLKNPCTPSQKRKKNGYLRERSSRVWGAQEMSRKTKNKTLWEVMKWQNEGRLVMAWCVSVRMAAGRAAS